MEYWVAQIQPGRVLYEIEGVPEDVARDRVRACSCQISVPDGVREADGDVMKTQELRDKSVDELNDELIKLRKEQFSLRMQSASASWRSTTCSGRRAVTSRG